MNPVAFKVVANTKDITPIIADRVVSITVTDNSGKDSDTVTIVLDDRDQKIAIPTIGAEMQVFLGEAVNGQPQLAWAGVFIIDEWETSDREGTLSLHGKSADMMGSLKAPRDESYDNITLSSLLTIIAKRHGYEPIISHQLASQHYEHIDQRAQSDIDLLTTKASELDAICKPTGKRLCLLHEDEGKTASGKPLPILPLDAASEGVYIHARGSGRSRYQSVKAYWQSPDSAKKHSVSMGGAEPQYIMSDIFNTHQQAVDAVKAKLAQLKRGGVELTCDRNMDLSFKAERTVNLFNHRHANRYVIKNAQHVIGKTVGVTRLTLKLPTAESSG